MTSEVDKEGNRLRRENKLLKEALQHALDWWQGRLVSDEEASQLEHDDWDVGHNLLEELRT